MYLRPISLLICLAYVALSTSQAYEEEQDKVQNALRVLEHLTETRKGLTQLRGVVDGIDKDLIETQKVKDLQRKRKGLEILKRILQEMDSDLVHEQKRTCLVNLGGHCATESAASMADQWHYLNSPLSPGRKRRDTGLYKKLISGKIFKKDA